MGSMKTRREEGVERHQGGGELPTPDKSSIVCIVRQLIFTEGSFHFMNITNIPFSSPMSNRVFPAGIIFNLI